MPPRLSAALAPARITAALKAVVLLGLSYYFAQLYFTGAIFNYITPQYTWLALSAAGLCIPLGLASVYDLLRPAAAHDHAAHDHAAHDHAAHDHSAPGAHDQAGHEHAAQQHAGHDHSAHQPEAHGVPAHAHDHAGHTHGALSWPVFALVALPLVLGLALPSRALGAAAVKNGSTTSALGEVYTWPATPDPLEWNLLDWRRAFYSNKEPKSWFDGREAEVVGFVVRPDGLPPGHFVLGRFVMRHCAADAYGVGMLVEWPEHARLESDTWLIVRGTLEAQIIDGGDVLVLHARDVDDSRGEPIPPYLSPWWNPKPEFKK